MSKKIKNMIDCLVERKVSRPKQVKIDTRHGSDDSNFPTLKDMSGGPIKTASSRSGLPVDTARNYLKYRRNGLGIKKASEKSGINTSQAKDLETSLKSAGYNPVSVNLSD